MATIRTFIAAELSGASSAWIHSTQVGLQKLVTPNAIKLTPLQQMHLTLVFLGEVDTRLIPKLVNCIDNSEINLPIDLSINRVGQFSRNGIVTVVWAGIEKNNRLEKVYSALVNNLGQFIKIEPITFKPHLTLARIKGDLDVESNTRLIKFTESYRLGLPIQESIRQIVLFKSDLKPSGPLYTRLHTIKVQDEIQ